MRTSLLSRSVIAVASLAIGSVALAATPATAATPSGVTRDQVLTAVNSFRNWETVPQATAEAQMRAVVRSSCAFTEADNVYFEVQPVDAGLAVDGALVKTYIDSDASEVRTQCLVAVLASADASKTLTGSLTMNAVTRPRDGAGTATTLPPATFALSSDVFIASSISVTTETVIGDSSFTANGNTTRSFQVTTTKKVADKKTKSEKKSAKKKFDKRNAAAKKAYKKALKKAGKSKNKKAAAKKAWSKKKASYKSTYRAATAGYKIVKITSTQVENSPFAAQATMKYYAG